MCFLQQLIQRPQLWSFSSVCNRLGTEPVMNLFARSENTLLTSGRALGKRALPNFGCKVEAPWLSGAFFRYCSCAEVNGAAVKHLKRFCKLTDLWIRIHSDKSYFIQVPLPGKIGVEFIQQGKNQISVSVKGVCLRISTVNGLTNMKIPKYLGLQILKINNSYFHTFSLDLTWSLQQNPLVCSCKKVGLGLQETFQSLMHQWDGLSATPWRQPRTDVPRPAMWLMYGRRRVEKDSVVSIALLYIFRADWVSMVEREAGG